jgi:hypothetical protein
MSWKKGRDGFGVLLGAGHQVQEHLGAGRGETPGGHYRLAALARADALGDIRRTNAARATVRSAVEHVFAAQKSRTKLVIRTVGIARVRAKLALANIA